MNAGTFSFKNHFYVCLPIIRSNKKPKEDLVRNKLTLGYFFYFSVLKAIFE